MTSLPVRRPVKGKRNGRRWFEDDELCVIDKHHAGPMLVSIAGMNGDTKEGEVIYTVEEVVSRQRYPASDRSLRKAKDRAEVDALIAVRSPVK